MGCCSHFHPLDFIRGIVKEREQFPCEVSPTILSTYLQHQKPKGTIRPLGNPNMLPPENVGKIRIEIVDRKSTRLNSSHVSISYAVFCLKKKNKKLYRKNA